VTGHKESERELVRQQADIVARHGEQHLLYELATGVNRAEALPDLYDKALIAIADSLHVRRASILLFDQQGRMRFVAWQGLSDAYRAAVDGHSPWTPEQRDAVPLLIEDVAQADLDPSLQTAITHEGIGALAFIPLTYGGRLIGKFMVYFDRPYRMSRDELDLAQAIADTLAVGIERKRAEAALRERQEQLRLAMEAGRLGMWEWNVVTNQVVWSAQLQAIHGLAPGEFDGTFAAYERDIHPDDRDRILKAVAQSRDQGALHHIEYRIVRPDGEIRWVEGRGSLFRDESGTPIRMIGVCSDITERKEAEEMLRESEGRFREMADTAPAMLWITDQAHRTTFLSRGWYDFTGQQETEGLGFGWTDAVHSEDCRRAESTFLTAAERKESFAIEYRLRRTDGVYRWVIDAGRPRYKADGTWGGYIGSVFDVHERVLAEERLQSFAAQLEQLVEQRTIELRRSQQQLRGLATELNLAEQRERKRLATELHDHMAQLLTLGKLHLAQSKRWTESIPQCQDYIARADEVLTEALTYARTLMHDLSPTVLHEFGLGAALVWLSERMKRHGLAVSIVSSLPSDTRLPEDRAVLLFQCVRELLMNVVKHAGSGRATVAVATEAQRLSIEVRDGGAGFDMQEALKTGGLGGRFGLFSIRERMAAMGGSFDLDSSPGMGTTARLTLPIEPATSASGRVRAGGQIDGRPVVGQGLAALGPAPPAGTGQHMIRVLLVDDHAMMRQGLRSVLEAYSDIEIVGEAGDGEEAIAGTERLRPSIVVMDINMPRMNGIEATSRIKQRFPETIVVGLSVNAAHDNQAAMAQAGASALLTKEAAVDQLYRNIQEALRRRHAPTLS
jgi:PAS domain S-box-containing protein